VRAIVSRMGEQHVWGKDPADLPAFLAPRGFTVAHTLAGGSLRAAFPGLLPAASVADYVLEDLWYSTWVRVRRAAPRGGAARSTSPSR
jgi:hypothetical protein